MPKSLISFLTQECLFLGSNQVRAVSHVTHIPAPFFGSFSDSGERMSFLNYIAQTAVRFLYLMVVAKSGL